MTNLKTFPLQTRLPNKAIFCHSNARWGSSQPASPTIPSDLQDWGSPRSCQHHQVPWDTWNTQFPKNTPAPHGKPEIHPKNPSPGCLELVEDATKVNIHWRTLGEPGAMGLLSLMLQSRTSCLKQQLSAPFKPTQRSWFHILHTRIALLT